MTIRKAFSAAVIALGVVLVGHARAAQQPPPQSPRVVEQLPVVDDLSKSVRFYHNVLGLQSPYDPRVMLQYWDVIPFLTEIYGGIDGQIRNVHFYVGSPDVHIEPVEFPKAKGKRLDMRLQDTGASLLMLNVRNLDTMLGYLKADNTKVVTEGGAPVTVTGPNGQSRAVVVESPNGFFVQLTQPIAPIAPQNIGPGGGVRPGGATRPEQFVISNDFALTVNDVERSAKFFREVFGVNVTVEASPRTDAKQRQLFGLKAGQYREAVVHWPAGTPQLYLRQFSDAGSKTFTPAVSDPNATLIRIRLRDERISPEDTANFLAKVKAFPDARIVNVSQGPTTPAIRFDGVPWLIVQVPGSSSYLQIVGGPGG